MIFGDIDKYFSANIVNANGGENFSPPPLSLRWTC
jgi:hypothetical protein